MNQPTRFHALTPADRVAADRVRAQTAATKGKTSGPSNRDFYDKLMQRTPAAAGVAFEAATVGVPGWWCKPEKATPGVALLYLHGGGFAMGSAAAYRGFASQVAARANVATFVAEYRLAPEHPFPAGLEDVQAAYLALVGLGFQRIAIVGDSAGGSLTLALLPLLRDAAVKPRAAVAISPFLDLTLSGDSMTTRADAEMYFTRESLADSAKRYAGANDLRDPRISPVFGALNGLPAVRLDASDGEILRDDSVRYAERLAAAGGDVELHLWEGQPHVFQVDLELDATRESLDGIAAFLRAHFA